MAIYHFSATIISRSMGQTTIAASTYRAADKIVDAQTRTINNFTKNKHNLIHKDIQLPEQSPTWISDRARLWNQVGSVKKCKDAQLAREFVFTLHFELRRDQKYHAHSTTDEQFHAGFEAVKNYGSSISDQFEEDE